jgi:hypothetical protein
MRLLYDAGITSSPYPAGLELSYVPTKHVKGTKEKKGLRVKTQHPS